MHIHFGDFLRHKLDQLDGPTKFAQRTGLSLASLTNWTRARTRDEAHMSTRSAFELASAIGYESTEAFDQAWQSTPVTPYPRRANGRASDARAASIRLADLMKLRGRDVASLSRDSRVPAETIESLLGGSRADRASVERLMATLRRHNDPPATWHEELIADRDGDAISLSQVLTFITDVNDAKQIDQLLKAAQQRRKVLANAGAPLRKTTTKR